MAHKGFLFRSILVSWKRKYDSTNKRSESDVKIGLVLACRIISQPTAASTRRMLSQRQWKASTISPTIDYVLSNRIQLKFYFDQRRSIPYVSSSAYSECQGGSNGEYIAGAVGVRVKRFIIKPTLRAILRQRWDVKMRRENFRFHFTISTQYKLTAIPSSPLL